MANKPDRTLLNHQKPLYLSRGRFANADVRLVELHQKKWIVKDFSACSPVIRQTIGRWMVNRELYALQLLSDLPGVPQEAYRLDEWALAYRFIDGTPIADLAGNDIPRHFFVAYEKLVTDMHRYGIVHLDLRNSGNIIKDAQGNPVMIDFQSWAFIPTWLPFLAQLLRKIDLSGVYKLWNNRLPGTMGHHREQLLASINRVRKGWIFSRYLGLQRFFKPREGNTSAPR
jgi:RIO-like serine/threonine protein kinase